MKRLWKLPHPWTPRTRPPLLGNPQNGFHKLPQAGSFILKGDISISLRMGTFLFRVDTCVACATLLFHDMHDRSHPGVDTALVLFVALVILDFFRPFARIKKFDRLRIAFRRNDRVA